MLIILFIVITAGTAGTMYGYHEKNSVNIAEPAAIPAAETKTVTVYVAGAVNNPGVTTVPDGSRVIDAITACGGVTADADQNNINMAELLRDGQQITVPEKIAIPTTDRYDEQTTPVADKKSSPSPSAAKSTRTININTATESELDELPGVGPATAKKIVEYRQNNGRFETPEDIKKVRGIGDGKFAKMKDMITT